MVRPTKDRTFRSEPLSHWAIICHCKGWHLLFKETCIILHSWSAFQSFYQFARLSLKFEPNFVDSFWIGSFGSRLIVSSGMVSSRDTNFAPYESAVGLKGVLAKPGATTGECSIRLTRDVSILDVDENIWKYHAHLHQLEGCGGFSHQSVSGAAGGRNRLTSSFNRLRRVLECHSASIQS